MCAYFSQSLKIKMLKNIVKIAMQFLLNLVLLYKNQKFKNTPQNLLHAFFIFGRASNKLLSGFSHFAIRSFFRFTFVTLQNCYNPSRISQFFNLLQNSLIHHLPFLVEPPAVFSKILERAFYVSQKHLAAFI